MNIEYETPGGIGTLLFTGRDLTKFFEHQLRVLEAIENDMLQHPHMRRTRDERIANIRSRRIRTLLATSSTFTWETILGKHSVCTSSFVTTLLEHGYGECLCNACDEIYRADEMLLYNWRVSDCAGVEYHCPGRHTVLDRTIAMGCIGEDYGPDYMIERKPLCLCGHDLRKIFTGRNLCGLPPFSSDPTRL